MAGGGSGGVASWPLANGQERPNGSDEKQINLPYSCFARLVVSENPFNLFIENIC